MRVGLVVVSILILITSWQIALVVVPMMYFLTRSGWIPVERRTPSKGNRRSAGSISIKSMIQRGRRMM